MSMHVLQEETSNKTNRRKKDKKKKKTGAKTTQAQNINCSREETPKVNDMQ